MNTLTCFSLSITHHVAHLVMNRPEAMNTMHPTFWRELDEVLAHLHQAGEARALVISSTGKHFSAGMALETFGGAITMDDQSPEGRAAIFDLLTDMQATFTRIENLRIPVIMAIQGGCIGGAVDMVTAACIRYATQDAFFCIQEINIGMVADVGTLAAPAQAHPAGRGERAGLHRPPYARARPSATAWSMRFSRHQRPCWPQPCNVRKKSPASRLWPSGAPSRP
jgi:enoyl-CoA hydratase